MRKLILFLMVSLMCVASASADITIADPSFEGMIAATWAGTPPDVYAYYSELGDWSGTGWTTQEGGYGVINIPDGTICGVVGAYPLSQLLADTYVEGETYVLTAMVGARTTGAGGALDDWSIELQNSSGTVLASEAGTFDLDLTGIWTQVSVPYVATAADDGDNIQIGFSSPGGGYKFVVDDVHLIPEPATMMMLGLGGLALIRRKR